MPERRRHRPQPDGRRFAAPPRRIPPAANDNAGPGRRKRIAVAITLAAVLALAAFAVKFSG